MAAAIRKTNIENLKNNITTLDPILQEHIRSCFQSIPLDAIISTQGRLVISDKEFYNTLKKPCGDLWVIWNDRATRYENQTRKLAKCDLIEHEPGGGQARRKTLFPSKAAAKDVNTACIYCTYSQVFFPEANNGENANAIATCTQSLFAIRQRMPGNQNATRDEANTGAAAAGGTKRRRSSGEQLEFMQGVVELLTHNTIPDQTGAQTNVAYLHEDEDEEEEEEEEAPLFGECDYADDTSAHQQTEHTADDGLTKEQQGMLDLIVDPDTATAIPVAPATTTATPVPATQVFASLDEALESFGLTPPPTSP